MAHIKTYARLKPTNHPYEEIDNNESSIYLRVPENLREAQEAGRGRGGSTNHEFKFAHVLNPNVSQKEVFETAAKSIVEGDYFLGRKL